MTATRPPNRAAEVLGPGQRPEGAAPASGARSLFDGAIVAARRVDSFVKLDPRTLAKNPVMFVVEVGAVLTTVLFFRDLGSLDAERERVRRPRRRRSSGSPCCSPTSPRRWPRAGARRRRRRCARPAARPSARVAAPTASSRRSPSSQLHDRRPVRRQRRRGDPRRRRRRRGHRHRRRVGHHRRVGARHPRVRRRPLGRHRRHPGAVRRDRRAHHGQAGRDVPRPHDRPRRGRRPPEDAERDRPVDPARRAHDHLPAGRRDAAAVRHLQRRRAADHRARRPARLPHPDDHRRPAVGHRHRRHGPPRAAQRAGDVGPGRRGRRRRDHAAARQDRHDHLRRPPGRRAAPRPRRHRGRAGRGGAGLQPGRRDARGPLDRRVRQAAATGLEPSRRPRRRAGAVHGPDPDERDGLPGRRRRTGAIGPQGRRRDRAADGRADAGGAVPLELGPLVDAISTRRRHAARRHRPAATARRRASSA